METKEPRPDAAYTYNPIMEWLRREKWILVSVFVMAGLVVAYRMTFPQMHIGEDRLPKYLRILNDFDSLITNLEAIRDRELEKKLDGGVGAVDAEQPKMRLFLIFDYLFVMELREESAFFAGYPPMEQELIRTLHRLGGQLDRGIISLYESSGNPEIPMDFKKMRAELAKARGIYDAERSR